MQAHVCSGPNLGRGARLRERPAFSLVELLVVIAVIAILAALLFPALNRAKLVAEDALCRSNLRQQAIGLAAYVVDFGAFPFGHSPLGSPTNEMWMQKLERYVGDRWPPDTQAANGQPNGIQPRGVYACPAYNRVGGMYWTLSNAAGGAYGYSAQQGPCVPARAPGRSVSIRPLGFLDGVHAVSDAQIAFPSQMIAIGDSQIISHFLP